MMVVLDVWYRLTATILQAPHFTVNGGTQDYVYRQSKARSLAQSSPEQAIFNADNHEYFAEDGL